eukprot:6212588-Pleurochrysis_carterae.AAC.6
MHRPCTRLGLRPSGTVKSGSQQASTSFELEKREGRLALKPLLDALKVEHAVDREVAAVLAQKVEVAQRREPLVVVHHDRVGRAVSKREELREDLPCKSRRR